LIVAACLLLAGLAVGLGSVLWREPPTGTTLAWFPEKTTSAPAGIPAAVRARIGEVARSGGGALTVVPVGEKSAQIAPVELTVLRGGDLEPDPKLRDAAITSRLTDMLGAVDGADVGATGFSIYGALQRMKDARDQAGGSLEVWWSTVLLTGSVDPLDMAQLRTFADPLDAAASVLEGPVGEVDLHGVKLHPLLLTPIGAGQQQLDPDSEQWRASFVVALAEGLGADVSAPLHDGATDPSATRASLTPPVSPLALSTPEHPGEPASLVVGDLAFIKRTATLDDEKATIDQLRSFAEIYLSRDHRDQVIEITGYCARHGTPESARELSEDRARKIAELLIALDIPAEAIESQGVGYDELADPTQPPLSAAQRVVIIRTRPADHAGGSTTSSTTN
jgi:outer membrane protein OmpA-like peptidoglycan-associated protein